MSANLTNTVGNYINSGNPSTTVKLVMIHHSTGSALLLNTDGGLGNTLVANNYYVRDINYGWDATQNVNIGDETDYGQYYKWFADTTIQGNAIAMRENIMTDVYACTTRTITYTDGSDPGGTHKVVLWKSCFPNSNVKDADSSTPADLYGHEYWSSAHTLPNIQQMYREVRAYQKTHTEKMFVLLTAPPLVQADTDSARSANARTLNNWLYSGWLSEDSWENKNIYVFDMFNVLTHANNHHRLNAGAIEHVIDGSSTNYAAYPLAANDSHPTNAGNLKVVGELCPLLNVYYHKWQRYLGNE